MTNCPSCNKEPRVNDYVSCQTKSCDEYKLKYLNHEWQSLMKDQRKSNELDMLEYL